jgi:ribosome modulation factor
MFPLLQLQRQLWWLDRKRRRLRRANVAEYKAEEKAGKSKDELCSLVQASARDYSYLDDEVIAAETTYLYEIAYRLRVPTPD